MEFNQEEIRKNIEAEIEKTRTKIASYREMTRPVSPDNAIGRVSRMDAIVNNSVGEAALRQAEQKLADLETMLRKVGDDDFGHCSKCGRPIPLKRLMLVPQSSLCVACAQPF